MEVSILTTLTTLSILSILSILGKALKNMGQDAHVSIFLRPLLTMSYGKALKMYTETLA